METKWNDQEDEALRGLSMLAQLIYLRVFRRHMDYATGMAGLRYRIDYQTICDAVGFVPDPGSKKRRWMPTKEEARAAVNELERARPWIGRPVPLLIEAGSGPHRGYVKSLPLATTDRSEQKGNPAGTPHEPRKMNNAENVTKNGDESACYQADTEIESRSEPRREKNAASAMNLTPPESGIREKESEAKASPCRASAPSRFGEFWDAWPTGQRKRDRHKAEQSWKRHKLDAMADQIITDVKRRAVEDQQWLRGYAPMPTTYLNGRRWEDEFEAPKSLASAQRSTLADRNREAMEEWLSGSATTTTGNVFDGEFCREA